MNSVNRSGSSVLRFTEPDAETESTESCSEEEGQADTQKSEAISQLARALMAWHPGLIGPDVAACAVHPAAREFAVFLSQLEIEARPRLDLRREVLAWLQGFRGDTARQQRVLDTVGRSADAMPAMALYRLLREAD
jgi:hypothetical protein